jgi:hypothetical protein
LFVLFRKIIQKRLLRILKNLKRNSPLKKITMFPLYVIHQLASCSCKNIFSLFFLLHQKPFSSSYPAKVAHHDTLLYELQNNQLTIKNRIFQIFFLFPICRNTLLQIFRFHFCLFINDLMCTNCT